MQKVEIECKFEIYSIDMKVVKLQRNKMVDRGKSNNILIQSLKENAKNKST